MPRFVPILVMLSLVFAAVDAGTDFELPAAGGHAGPHEAHGQVHDDPTAPFSEDEQAEHFCHCAAHAPFVAASVSLVSFASPHATPRSAAHFSGAAKTPPLLPPPISA